jgi:hypothetical protein
VLILNNISLGGDFFLVFTFLIKLGICIFVKEGMSVDVRIDSFPHSKFRDVKGTLTVIGSRVLELTQENIY